VRRPESVRASASAPEVDVDGRRAPWHALPCEEALAALGSDARSGLAEGEAAERARRHGPNALPEHERRSLLSVLLRQFKNPLIYLLLAVGVLAFAMGEHGDALVILVVVLLNAVIGAFQEGRAERSLAELRALAGHEARVIREGKERVLDARGVVPGDLLLLSAGDAIAADARLVEVASLQVAEAALTGESLPVAKAPLPLAADTLVADRSNMVFAGTHVTAGRGRALVVAARWSWPRASRPRSDASPRSPPRRWSRRRRSSSASTASGRPSRSRRCSCSCSYSERASCAGSRSARSSWSGSARWSGWSPRACRWP
jgi:Ca2+-transporting ATPase